MYSNKFYTNFADHVNVWSLTVSIIKSKSVSHEHILRRSIFLKKLTNKNMIDSDVHLLIVWPHITGGGSMGPITSKN